MGQGECHHRQLEVCWSHCRGVMPGSGLVSIAALGEMAWFYRTTRLLVVLGPRCFRSPLV